MNVQACKRAAHVWAFSPLPLDSTVCACSVSVGDSTEKKKKNGKSDDECCFSRR